MLNAAGAVNATGRLYLLLDANVVADFFLGTHAGNQKAAGRIQAIVEAVRTQAVTSIVLYVPNICIPEVMSAFDKQAFGIWNKQVKNKLDVRRHRRLRRLFSEYIHNGTVFEQYEVNRYHVLATDLISPIDHRYQITRKTTSGRRVTIPMQAVDHLIVGMGIVLVRIAGRDNVLLLTSDQRMCAVIDKARDKVSSPVARELGLPERAKALGYKWTVDLFPRVLNLKTATKVELVSAFGQWPLSAPVTSSGPRAQALPKWAIV
jgi:hypothetical protein